MDKRVPTRPSKHGYPIYEQTWKPEVHNFLYTEGLDETLSRYTHEEVLGALGGDPYGAKIEDDYIIYVKHFDNTEHRSWEEVDPIIEAFESVGAHEIVGTTLTKTTMLLQLKKHRALCARITVRASKEIEQAKNADEQRRNRAGPATDNELKGYGYTDTEVAEYWQTIAQTGYTPVQIVVAGHSFVSMISKLNNVGVTLMS